MKSRSKFDDAYVGLFTTAGRVAERILGDASAGEDIAVETLARALVSWRRVGGGAEPWVIRMATNLSLDSVKHRRPRSAPADARSDDAVVGRVEVLDGLRHLSRRQGQVVTLHYLVGLSDEDIAGTLSIPGSEVTTHLERGLLALRDRLPPAEPAESDGTAEGQAETDRTTQDGVPAVRGPAAGRDPEGRDPEGRDPEGRDAEHHEGVGS